MRYFILLALLPMCFTLQAQFGPNNYAFISDVNYPSKIFIDDVNGDGAQDVIIYHFAYHPSTGLYWYANDGAGNFNSRTLITPANNFALHENDPFADINGDGDPDMIVPTGWYANDGNGSFPIGTPFPTGFNLHFHADIDSDGDVDLFGILGGELSPLWNDGSGNFTIGTGIPFIGGVSTALTDIDGDGVNDLLVSGDANARGWYQGLGGGTFGPQQSINVFDTPFVAKAGDVDGNGTIDLIKYSTAAGTRWFSNNGSGNFTEMDTIQFELWGPYGDIDGDGDIDFAANTGTSCDVKWVRNDGDGLAWSLQNLESFSAYNLSGTKQALGDLNGDGTVDLAFTSGMGIAGWYPLASVGVHAPRERIGQTMAGGNGIRAVDVDLDGDLDLVASAHHGDWLMWFPNNGDGTFAYQIMIAEHLDQVKLLDAADIDGDGDIDLITNKASAAIVWNNNAGSSWAPQGLPNDAIPRALADMDGDGDLDIIGTGAWFANNNGSFVEVVAADLAIGGIVKAADLNADGLMDLVIGNNTATNILLNNGAGGYDIWSHNVWTIGTGIGDLDGDGDLDIAIVASSTNQHSWFQNDGNGDFTIQPWLTSPPAGARAILVNDLNGDGVADIVWSRSQGYTHESFFVLNDGTGNFGDNTLIDPAAEVTADLILADVNGDVVEDLISIRHHSITWRENHFFDAFRLRGDVFKDFNANGVKDGFDVGLPYLLMNTDPQAMLIWTNTAGAFDLPVDSGVTYQLWPQLPQNFQVTSDPAVHTALANEIEPIVGGLNFGVGPNASDNDDMLIFTASDLRCNMEGTFWAVVRNTGSWISENIFISMTLNEDLTFIDATPAPDSISNNTIYWHLDSLPWFAVHNFVVYTGLGPVGSTAAVDVAVEFTDEPHTLTYNFSQQVTCAFDPNDKQVLPIGYGSHGAIPIDTEWLDYTIRFQNTGNDTAFSVVLVDHLSHDLDWASMEVLGTSHDLSHIGIDHTGKLQFRYEPIMLPDSGVNMAASNGFVRFRMKPVTGVPSGTVIQNTAEIYFDLNLPVITNTVTNTLIDCGLYTATFTLIEAGLLQAAEGDAYQWFHNGLPIEDATSADLVLFATGSYSVEITNSDGCTSMSDEYWFLPTTVEEPYSLNMALVPNPNAGSVRLICSSVITPDHIVEISDLHGRLVHRTYGVGTREIHFDASDLSNGIYLVRISQDGMRRGSARMVVTR